MAGSSEWVVYQSIAARVMCKKWRHAAPAFLRGYYNSSASVNYGFMSL